MTVSVFLDAWLGSEYVSVLTSKQLPRTVILL